MPLAFKTSTTFITDETKADLEFWCLCLLYNMQGRKFLSVISTTEPCLLSVLGILETQYGSSQTHFSIATRKYHVLDSRS